MIHTSGPFGGVKVACRAGSMLGPRVLSHRSHPAAVSPPMPPGHHQFCHCLFLASLRQSYLVNVSLSTSSYLVNVNSSTSPCGYWCVGCQWITLMASMSRFVPQHVSPIYGHRGSASNLLCRGANPNLSTPRSQSLAVPVRNPVSVCHPEFVPNVSLSKS